jgi:hypothetical protein
MDVLLSLGAPFVHHPERSAAVALLLGLLAWKRHAGVAGRPWLRSPLGLAALLWAAAALWEGVVMTLSPEANIRVDLLLLWPALLLVTVWSLLRAWRR